MTTMEMMSDKIVTTTTTTTVTIKLWELDKLNGSQHPTKNKNKKPICSLLFFLIHKDETKEWFCGSSNINDDERLNLGTIGTSVLCKDGLTSCQIDSKLPLCLPLRYKIELMYDQRNLWIHRLVN